MTRLNCIPILSVATVNACQNVCEHCAHQGIRDEDPAYQMPLGDLDDLIARFQTLGCRAGLVSMCGPGEPLLWRNFNEGVRRLSASAIADRVEATTNGRALGAIAKDVWPLLDPLFISDYGDGADLSLAAGRANVVVRDKGDFVFLDEGRLPWPTVCLCGCPGMTYYKRRLYPHCGPVVFDALRRRGVGPEAVSVALADYDPAALPRMDLPCRWCWGNTAVNKATSRHRTLNRE